MITEPTASGHVVLVVDDEPHYLAAVGADLEAHPAFKQVQTANSGEEAIACFDLLKPDIAVLDVVMPGMTGFQVAMRLRALQPQLRVVLISAVPESGFEEAAHQVGAYFVPKKLFSAARLADLLAERLS